METEEGSGIATTNYVSNETDAAEMWQHTAEITESGVGKAVARRAVYGSSQPRRRGRKVRIIDNKTRPSRLSKVSLADEPENN